MNFRTRLIVRKERWTLTWLGRVLVFGGMLGVTLLASRHLGAFLAVDTPIEADVLVVEAWLPNYAYRAAVSEFHEGKYTVIAAAGTVPEDADERHEEKEFFATGRLIALGVPPGRVAEASHVDVGRDRTLHSALAVRDWMESHGLRGAPINVVTLGTHARRTRFLYREAFGKDSEVGVICVPDRGFDLRFWWRSSQGVRTVLGEAIAYFYARGIAIQPGERKHSASYGGFDKANM